MHDVMYIYLSIVCIYELWLYDNKVCIKMVIGTMALEMNDYHFFNFIDELYHKEEKKIESNFHQGEMHKFYREVQ